MTITVLIVDDSKLDREITKDLLKGTSYQIVAEAKDGIEGINLAELHCPDIVILDWVMPILDGMSALRGIKEVCPSARVVVASSLGGWADAAAHAEFRGADGVLAKPVSKDGLLHSLSEVLEFSWN